MDQIFQARSSTTSSTADDSDNDEVIDFLNINPTNSIITTATASTTNTTTTTTIHVSDESVQNNNNCIPRTTTKETTNKVSSTGAGAAAAASTTTTIIKLNNNINTNNNNNNSNNMSTMIPTINVTPHSPASANKYNNLFEDTLNQLHTIRESVVQMRNSNVHMQDGLIHAAILSSSLPDLTAAANAASSAAVACGITQTTTGGSAMKAAASGAAMTAAYLMWSPQQQQYLLNTDRRKSWTAADDLAVGADSTNKSISLSSLDSEEQETIRVTEQRRRNARNSTGGISTHSLNEAELARDFERIATKRSLATEIISRIPLQKSISTSSIVAKEDSSNNHSKAIGRHLTDSEDENQSLLRAHHNAKVEVYDNVEKRRKRGSLFFRKKKDKAKLKMLNNGGATNASGINATCEVCGATVSSLNNMKDHQLECAKVKKFISGQKLSFSKKSGNDMAVVGGDFYDGSITTDQATYYNDDAPLIRAEFLNDPPIVAQDLGADPLLGIVLEEHDSWSPSVPKELLKTLKEKQIKRQEHIYEFIMTEKHHCQTLLVMQKIFVESLERHFSSLNVHAMFPRLVELTLLHTNFLRQLRQKQREQPTVDSIADILLDFFSGDKAQQLRVAYGEFCANHRTALEQFKSCITSRDQRFAEWYKHSLTNPLLKKKGIPECILFVTQRLTKYPLLIEPLLKSARDNVEEAEKLQQALNLVKGLLVDVDACVAEKELRERQIELVNRIDSKSFAIYRHKPFRKSDVAIESRRRLKFEGLATLLQGRSKMQLVLVVVLTDCLCFFVENSAHNKYTFFTPEHKAGVVPLQKLLIREKAGTGTESRGIYIISSNPDFPEMYELKVQQPKDKNVWIQSIRQAVLECPPTPLGEHAVGHNIEEHLTSQQIICSNEYRREIVEQLRQKDIEQALLLEEKLHLQLNLLNKTQIEHQQSHQLQVQQDEPETVAAQLLAAFSNISYKDLVTVETDTTALWQRVQYMVQEISQLASSVYNTATGVPLSRAINAVGDKVTITADNYASPTLPKRAETFAGFDEKRAKHLIFPSAKLAAMQKLTPRLQELEEKRESGGKCVSSGGIVGATGGTTQQQQQQMPLDDTLKDHNHVAMQITHNLHTLLCIISQQMTSIHQLQLQLALYRESPRFAYTHNDQLEELRNLQDKLQEEKTAWARQREQQEQELEEKRLSQLQLQEQIKIEQEDIKQQREQLYRKMELLSSQGLLLSPNTNIASPVLNNNNNNTNTNADVNADGHEVDNGSSTPTSAIAALAAAASTVERRKDKWRTASTCSKTPPVNLLSANNAPKISQQTVKQKIPMKLSSLSSIHHSSSNMAAIHHHQHHHSSQMPSSYSKSASFSANNNNNNNNNSSSNNAGLTQIFPLKLADKKPTPATTSNVNSNVSFSSQPQHARTGSSPAIIQHPRSTMGSGGIGSRSNGNVTRSDSMVHYGTKAGITTTTTTTPTSSRQQITKSTVNGKPTIADEEEIYF